MEKIIEITSQVAGIGSLILAIIALFLIKPISNYYRGATKTSNSKVDSKIENNFHGPVHNYGEGFSPKIGNQNESLVTNNNQNGE